MVEVELIQAIGNLGALPLLGFLLYHAIKIRKNGNGRIGKVEEKVNQLVVDVALLKAHFGIKEEK